MTTCIITPTFNNEDYTIRCFDSIRKNTNDYLIIWIDNGSAPKSREKVAQFLKEKDVPHEAIFNKDNLGFVKATNQGMKKALELGAKYIILENNDTEVYAGWLGRLIEVVESDPKIGLVGPLTSPCQSWQSIEHVFIKYPEFLDLPKYDNNPEEYAKTIREKYKGKSMQVSPMVAFFCTLIKSEVARQIGLLSEDYGVGFADDDDYCTRARRAGWKIMLAADVFIFHNHRTTFKSLFTEDKIKEMKKKNLTIFRDKFSDDKEYDFERLVKKGKIDGEKDKLTNFSLQKAAFKKVRFILKNYGILTLIKYILKNRF